MSLLYYIKEWDKINKKILFKFIVIDNCDLSFSIIEWNIALAKKDYNISKLIFLEFSELISIYKEISFNVNNQLYDNIIHSHATRDLMLLLMELCNNFKELNIYLKQ